MRRTCLLILLFLLTTLGGACQTTTTAVSTLSPTPNTPTRPTDPTITPPLQPTATATAVPTPTPIPRDLSLREGRIYVYPQPTIYEGDKVTFQIMAYVPDLILPEEVVVRLHIPSSGVTHDATLSTHSLGGHPQAVLEWVWDTRGQVGTHQVEITLDPEDRIQTGDEKSDNNHTTLSVTIQPHRTGIETNRIWKTADLPCCHVHVVSNTAADRDLPDLLTAVDRAVAQASLALDEVPQRPLDIYLIDRVLGQGGYAGGEMVVSYLDRNYVGFSFHELLAHEAVHLIDRQFAPQRISFLAEGVAVWAAGGHYKAEDLHLRTAALYQIGRYVPLADMVDEFYTITQHEVGYLQAAGLVNYLVDTYGWLRFREFYSDVTYQNGRSLSDVMDEQLQIHYQKTLPEMEAEWLAYLTTLELPETAVADLQISLEFYNVMRRYQQQYDPTAHFLTAWLPSPNQVRQHGNPADLTRHPKELNNITFEVMLNAAAQAILNGDYSRAQVILDSITRALDNQGDFMDPLATSYHNIVIKLDSLGFETHRVELSGDRAVAWATARNSVTLLRKDLYLSGQAWWVTN